MLFISYCEEIIKYIKFTDSDWKMKSISYINVDS